MATSSIKILKMANHGEAASSYSNVKNGLIFSTIASAKGSVRRIRFAPGKGNTKILILYSNRLDVRDALEVRGWLK